VDELWLLLWVICGFFAYPTFRVAHHLNHMRWDSTDRFVVVVISCMGPAALAGAILSCVIAVWPFDSDDDAEDDDEESDYCKEW
jgi:hypothetical protein